MAFFYAYVASLAFLLIHYTSSLSVAVSIVRAAGVASLRGEPSSGGILECRKLERMQAKEQEM